MAGEPGAGEATSRGPIAALKIRAKANLLKFYLRRTPPLTQRQTLRIAVPTARTHLLAAGNWIPSGFGPLDFGVSHGAPLH